MTVPSQIDEHGERSVVLEVPMPPSLNRLWRIGKNRATGKRFLMRSPAYEKWLLEAGWEIQRQKKGLPVRSISGLYSLTIEVGLGQNADLDNRIKAISDLLQAQDIIQNDRLCRKLVVLWGNTDGCQVEVTPFLPST